MLCLVLYMFVGTKLVYRFVFSIDLSEAVDVYSDWIDACETANT